MLEYVSDGMIRTIHQMSSRGAHNKPKTEKTIHYHDYQNRKNMKPKINVIDSVLKKKQNVKFGLRFRGSI